MGRKNRLVISVEKMENLTVRLVPVRGCCPDDEGMRAATKRSIKGM
jgi:hypothetical protein